MSRAAQLAGWTPIRFYFRDARPCVDWCHIGRARFTDPFFDQTVGHALANPFSLLFRPQTPVEVLEEFAATQPTLAPTGFIFHLSRCGSTVVSQMLATLAQNVVVSEACVVDAVMRASFYHAVSDEERARWLRATICALGQRRHAGERHYFVKFDGWHTLELSLVRRVFPAVPCLFVHRAPLEVMASQLRRSARWMQPGDLPPRVLGLDAAAICQMPSEEYCARVLARICETALRHASDGRVLLVNHRQLPEVVFDSLLRFFRVAYTDDEIEAMRATAQFHAKEPELRYADDSETKRRAVNEATRAAVERWVNPVYERLETARRETVESAPRARRR